MARGLVGPLAMLAAFLIAAAPTLAAQTVAREASTPFAAEPAKFAVGATLAASFPARDVKVTCRDRHELQRIITPVGLLYLTVRNDGTVPVSAMHAEVLAPSDLVLCAAGSGEALPGQGPAVLLQVAIAPGQTMIVPLAVGSIGTPRAGTLPLLVEVHLAGKIAGRDVDDDVLISDKIQFDVPGLSDTLKLFGAPTLFLLPGVLVLGALGMSYRPKDTPWLAANSASFWIVSVMIALVISTVYGLAHKLLGSDHNLVDRYDLVDVGLIWAISLAIGGAVGAILQRRATVAQALVATAATEAAIARTPLHSDDPRTFLDRLALVKVSVTNRWYEAGGSRGFLVSGVGLQPPWLMPQITHRQLKPPMVDQDSWDAARSALDAFLAAPVLTPRTVIDELDKPLYAPILPLEWVGGVELHAILATDGLLDRGEMPLVLIR